MENIYSKIKQALLKDELTNYLLGEGEYNYVPKYSNVPTDFDEAFFQIKKYYTDSNDFSIWNKFEKSLIEITKNPKTLWIAPYYMMYYLYFSKSAQIKAVDVVMVINNINYMIIQFEIQLKKDKSWIGKDYPNGLYDDVMQLLKIIHEEFKY